MLILATIFCSNVRAQTASLNNTFESVDDEVGLSVQRGTGEVKLLLQLKDVNQYDHIIVERSAESPNYFGKCKYISFPLPNVTDGKISEADKYPYAASKNVYYRIKTVTKDGVERAYPAVLLAAVSQ